MNTGSGTTLSSVTVALRPQADNASSTSAATADRSTLFLFILLLFYPYNATSPNLLYGPFVPSLFPTPLPHSPHPDPVRSPYGPGTAFLQ